MLYIKLIHAERENSAIYCMRIGKESRISVSIKREFFDTTYLFIFKDSEAIESVNEKENLFVKN